MPGWGACGSACRVRADRGCPGAAERRAGNRLAGGTGGAQARRLAAGGTVVRRGLRRAERSRLPGTAAGARGDRRLGGARMDVLPVGARRRGGLVGCLAALARVPAPPWRATVENPWTIGDEMAW